MAIAPIGPTLPEAGVMATRPATAPVTMPSTLGLPCLNHSTTIQVKAAIAQAEADLAQGGRLLIRKSGTEPLVRVMAEHEDAALMERAVDSVVEAVNTAVGS